MLLVLSALAVTLLFGVSSLDIAAARWFYRPTGVDHWPLAAQAPWPLLYRASPWVTAGLLGVGRMAAGAHFLSDILWSALLAAGVSHILYYHEGIPTRWPLTDQYFFIY